MGSVRVARNHATEVFHPHPSMRVKAPEMGIPIAREEHHKSEHRPDRMPDQFTMKPPRYHVDDQKHQAKNAKGRKKKSDD